VYVTYFAPTADLEQALTAQGSIEDWVAATGGYDLQEALTVYVGEP
jgi:predicted flavoprotein YhiN